MDYDKTRLSTNISSTNPMVATTPFPIHLVSPLQVRIQLIPKPTIIAQQQKYSKSKYGPIIFRNFIDHLTGKSSEPREEKLN
jgi:hypothetical protein